MLVFSNKHRIKIFFIIAFLLVNCSKYAENKKFNQLSEKFLKQYCLFYPVQATQIGIQGNDDKLNDYAVKNINERIQTLNFFLQQAALIDTNKLSDINKINYAILSSQLKIEQFELKRWKRWQNDATLYTLTIYNALIGLTLHNKDTTVDRAQDLFTRLKLIPDFLNQDKNNLQLVNSINLITAIDHVEKLKRIIAFRLSDKFLVNQSILDTLVRQCEITVDSLESFKKFLESKMKSAPDRSLAMTPELYETYINLILHDEVQLQELIEWINSDCQIFYDDILNTSIEILSERNKSNEHVKHDNLIEKIDTEIEKQILNKNEIIPYCYDTIDEIKRFIDEIWNLSLPINYSIQIEWAEADIINPLKLAYLEKPGLLEKGTQFYCLLNPISNDGDWIQQLSILRNYNKPALKVTMMLETIASHYQIWLERIDKIPAFAKIFPDQIFLNSWSYYLAFSMLDAGFGGYDSELRYMLLKEYVRVLQVAKVEIQYYLQQLSLQQLERLLMESKLFTRNEIDKVRKEIVRSPGQFLTIYWGVRKLKGLEKNCRKMLGPKFNLNTFFQRTLRQGPIPIELVEQQVITQFQTDKTH